MPMIMILPMNKAMTATAITAKMHNGAMSQIDISDFVCSFFANQPLEMLEMIVDKSNSTRLLARIAVPVDVL